MPLADISSRAEQHGTRHKAALGISEQSDAIIVVVSEETGNVSLAHSGKLITKLDRERLRYNLRTLLEPSPGLGLGRRSGRRKPLTTSGKNQEESAKNKTVVKEDSASKPGRTVKDNLTQKEAQKEVQKEVQKEALKDNRAVKEETLAKETVSTGKSNQETVQLNANPPTNPTKEVASANGTPESGPAKTGGNGVETKETITPTGSTNGLTNKDTISPNGNGNGNSNGNGSGDKDAKTLKDKDGQASVGRSDKR